MKKRDILSASAACVFAASQAGAVVYQISGSFNYEIHNSGLPLIMPFEVLSGSYDTVTGAGRWHATLDATQAFGGAIFFDQDFTLDAGTGVGAITTIENYTGSELGCAGLGPELIASIDGGGPIGEGLQNWEFLSRNIGNQFYRLELTAVPVPTAAWLFSSALLGLAGVWRRGNFS